MTQSYISRIVIITGVPPLPVVGANLIGKVKKVVEHEALLVELPGGRDGRVDIVDVCDCYLHGPLRHFAVGMILK